MRTIVTIPIPLDSVEVWDAFHPFIERFCETWRINPPGVDCEIIASCCNDGPNDDLRTMFHDLPVSFVHYSGEGCDLGSAQQIACAIGTGFMVNCTSRCYFHRPDWLKRLVTAREAIGPDLFGCFASHESGRLHVCTRAYSLDAQDFALYPVQINSRNLGVFFECGDGNLMEWFEARNKKPWVVGWSGIHERSDWFKIPNRFRNGDQSDCLVFDKHTDIYRNAEGEFKMQLEEMANNGGYV